MAEIRDGNFGDIKSFLSFAFSMTEFEISERIKQTAHDLVMQYGIRSVSMDEIATTLGISKKTIYQHFADKDELVEAVIQDVVRFNQQCCSKDREQSKDAIHEIFLAMEMMQEMFQDMNPAIIFELEKFHPKAFKIFLDHKYNFLSNVLLENIHRGRQEGLVRDDFDEEVIVKLRIETILLPFNIKLFPKNKYQLVELGNQFTEHYLYGIASAKGCKLIVKYKQDSSKRKNKQ